VEPECFVAREVQGRQEKAVILVMPNASVDIVEPGRIDRARLEQPFATDTRRLDGFGEGVDENH
jgi:hypothetical protein